MRQALVPAGRQPARKAPALIETRTIPAPVKGWTAQDSLVEAPPGTAPILDNWFPEADAVRIRRGYESFSTGVGGSIRTMMAYVSGTVQKMFAARSNGSIYDTTSAGAATLSYSTGRSSGDYQWTMFGNVAGQYLYVVNGSDPPIYFDGSAWVVPVLTDMPDTTNLIGIVAHKKRLWFAEENTPSVWYLDTDAIAGSLSEFDISGQLTKGGHIMALATWTVDGGAGVDDLMAIISSEGQVVVYTGIDPTSATQWLLQGVYDIGKPIGRKSVYKLGGDLVVVTEDGLIPMSVALLTDRTAAAEKSYSRRIRRAYNDAVRLGVAEFGWQLETHPRNQMALLNIPPVAGTPAQQFVYNVTTGAWARWTNMDATCWLQFQGGLYFGGPAGTVFKADSGTSDNGAAIPARMLPAFDDLGAPGRVKYVTGITPILSSDVPNADARPSVVCAVDYTEPGYTNQVADEISLGVGNFGVWGVSLWGQCVWFGQSTTRKWRSGGGIGKAISPAFSVDLASATSGSNFLYRVIGFDINFQYGAQL